jgi:magnesium chelatase family protein
VVSELAEVRGQEAAKRALEVAAAGGHRLLLVGPGGAGNSLLARCLPRLLSGPFEDEAAIAETYRRAGLELPERWPVRVPGLVLTAKRVPREIALAAHGVLIVDDLPALQPAALRALAEALDRDGPHVQVVATMRPCPCGNLGEYRAACTCTAAEVRRYGARVALPLADRFDVFAAVPAVTLGELRGPAGDPSAHVAARVAFAREFQFARGGLNAAMRPAEVVRYCRLNDAGQELLGAAYERLALSAAAVCRVLRVARTLADLTGAVRLGAAHVAEAIQYRP